MPESKRDYSSIYSVKEFVIHELAPKYFNVDEINQLNIGLLGMTTELIANTTEDTFNAVSTFIKEIFPNKAAMPETIYNNAALYQIDSLFANPASMDIVLFVNEDDIKKYSTKKDTYYEFNLDSELIIDVEGKQFMMDYDIIIISKPYRNDYIYTAMYDLNFNNSLSDITNPYIKTKRIRYSNANYLALMIKVRQVNKTVITETILNNDKINLPTIYFDFNDQLANFEIFYKESGSNSRVQLKRKLMNSTPLKEPFFFYKFKNDQQIEISFTPRDNYFQPAFNSELTIYVYTTTGSQGNFPLYKGNNITVLPKSEKYTYNNSIILFALTQSESILGKDSLTLDELKAVSIEKMSTVDSYTNENDLQIYFTNFEAKYKSKVLFIKKRDDALERLFSAYSLLKDPNGDIYPTNTVHINFKPDDFDLAYEQSNRYIFRPGHLFRYRDDSIDTVEVVPNKMLKDDFSDLNDKFIYTNPYLMTVAKSPAIVGYYMNSLNERIPLEYSYVNNDSIVQFVCNNLFITRNALIGEDEYTLSINITPTLDLDNPIIDPETKEDLGILKIKGFIEDSGSEMCYIDFYLKSYDEATNIYTYEAKLKTDDYMTLAQKFRVFDVHNIETTELEDKLIPMIDCKMSIYAFYKFDDMKLSHKFDYIPDVAQHSLTNIYSTIDTKITFINPINSMRSQMKYINVNGEDYNIFINFVPLVKAETMKDPEKYADFIEKIKLQYEYLLEILDKVINNFGIDMKFYNTFGKSKNFVAGEEEIPLDRVNCSIRFKIAPTVGAVINDLVRDLKIFIKNYIEGINNKGSNNIYVSNLISSIEETFSDVRYMKFVKINDYDSSIQAIENKTIDLNLMTKEDRRNYVPEYLTVDINDVIIDLLS